MCCDLNYKALQEVCWIKASARFQKDKCNWGYMLNETPVRCRAPFTHTLEHCRVVSSSITLFLEDLQKPTDIMCLKLGTPEL